MSDHNSIEPLDRFASKFDWRTAGMFLAWFSDSKLCVLTFIYAQIAKFVIYDQVRVNGGNNYEYPGQRWVLKLVPDKPVEE